MGASNCAGGGGGGRWSCLFFLPKGNRILNLECRGGGSFGLSCDSVSLPEEDVEGRGLGEATLGGGDHCRGGSEGPIADIRTGEEALLGEAGGDTVEKGRECELAGRGEVLEGREPNGLSCFRVWDNSNPENASSKEMP